MILPKQERNELINGLLPLLAEATDHTQKIVKRMGSTVLAAGVTETLDGKRIEPNILYNFLENVPIKVNHKRRLLEVIARAPTLQGMQDDLARYLVKFGKSKAAITESISKNKKSSDEKNL